MVVGILLLGCTGENGGFDAGGGGSNQDGGGLVGTGDDDTGNGGDSDDTGQPGTDEVCDEDDLLWEVVVSNEFGQSENLFTGQSFSITGRIENLCDGWVSVDMDSDCLFDTVSLDFPSSGEQTQVVSGCSTTDRTLEIGPYEYGSSSYYWGTLYNAGTYTATVHFAVDGGLNAQTQFELY